MAEQTGKDECPTCHKSFTRVAQHWARSQCGYPDIPRTVQDVLQGLLLTGGTVFRHNEDANPVIRYGSSDRQFLRWVYDQLGVFAGSITEASGGGIKQDHWETTYELTTKAHPEYIVWLGEWMTSDGTRRVPNDVSITPRGLRVAYAATGNIRPHNGIDRASILVTRAAPSEQAVQSAFEGYAPYRSAEADRMVVNLRNSTGFFNDIGWDAPSFATHRWPDRELSEPEPQCPACQGRFVHLGKHWATGCIPTLSADQEAIIRALIVAGVPFGDPRSTGNDSRLQSIVLQTTNAGFVEDVIDQLDWLVASHTIAESAEEIQAKFDDWIVEEDAGPETKDLHQLRTRTHPRITEFQRQVVADEFEQTLLDEGVTETFYRALFAFKGAVIGSEDDVPHLSATKWRLSTDGLDALFDAFDGVVRETDDTRYLRLYDADRFFEVIGREPVPGCEHRWGPYTSTTAP